MNLQIITAVIIDDKLSFLNLFRKKLTLDRVVPIISKMRHFGLPSAR